MGKKFECLGRNWSNYGVLPIPLEGKRTLAISRQLSSGVGGVRRERGDAGGAEMGGSAFGGAGCLAPGAGSRTPDGRWFGAFDCAMFWNWMDAGSDEIAIPYIRSVTHPR